MAYEDYSDCYYIQSNDLKKLFKKTKFKGNFEKFIADFGFEDMKTCPIHKDTKIDFFTTCPKCYKD